MMIQSAEYASIQDRSMFEGNSGSTSFNPAFPDKNSSAYWAQRRERMNAEQLRRLEKATLKYCVDNAASDITE